MPGGSFDVRSRPARASRGARPLVTLEAMKMEHALTAPFDGAVAEVRCAVGDQVTEGALLVRLAPQD